MKSTIDQKLALLLAEMTKATDGEVMEVFQTLKEKFCHYCGRKQGQIGQCQCWNDE